MHFERGKNNAGLRGRVLLLLLLAADVSGSYRFMVQKSTWIKSLGHSSTVYALGVPVNNADFFQ